MKNTVQLLTLGRSGGTFLKNILDRSPNLAMAGEMHIINPFSHNLGLFEWFSYVENSDNPKNALIEILFIRKKFPGRILGSFWNELEKYIDCDSFIENLNNGDLSNPIKFVEKVLRTMSTEKDKEKYGIHYPVHPIKAGAIRDWWPESKIIYLDRHPCAIIASKLFHSSTLKRKRKYWFVKPFIHYGFILYIILNHILVSRSISFMVNCLVISHEELKRSPEKIIKKLCNFCDINYTKEMLQADGKRSSFSGNKKVSSLVSTYRWKFVLSDFEKNIILRLTRNSRNFFLNFNSRDK